MAGADRAASSGAAAATGSVSASRLTYSASPSTSQRGVLSPVASALATCVVSWVSTRCCVPASSRSKTVGMDDDEHAAHPARRRVARSARGLRGDIGARAPGRAEGLGLGVVEGNDER